MDNVSFLNIHQQAEDIDNDDDTIAIVAVEDASEAENQQPKKRFHFPSFWDFTQPDLLFTLNWKKIAVLVLAFLTVLCIIFWCFYGLSKAGSSSSESPESANLNGSEVHHSNKKELGGGGTELSPKSPALTTTPTPAPDPNLYKAEFVRNMTISAFHAYKDHAWGHSSLKPETRQFHNDIFGPKSGRTLVSALSTLYIMKLTDDFEHSKRWVRDSLDLWKIDKNMNVGDLVTDYIGGLLASFALTGDKMFKEKAVAIAKMIGKAYETRTGLPYELYNPAKNEASKRSTWLTWVGCGLLEYNYLVDISNDTTLATRYSRMRSGLAALPKISELYTEMVNVETGTFEDTKADFGWATRQFYISIAKSWIQTNRGDNESLIRFNKAIYGAEKAGMFFRSKSGLLYVHPLELIYHRLVNAVNKEEFDQDYEDQKDNKEYEDDELTDSWGNAKMKYHSCYLGGLLSLMAKGFGADVDGHFNSTKRIGKYEKMAEELTKTCYLASNRSKTKLAPWTFYFTGDDDATNSRKSDLYETGHFLNPELAETYFLMWRHTHNPKYRDYAWEMVQALEAHTKTASGGYSHITNVNEIPTKKEDYQAPYLFGTFKYLYLIFLSDDVLPLDRWVFNTVGQPLPIFTPRKKLW